MSLVECRPATTADLPLLLPVVRDFYAHFGFVWNERRKQALLTSFLGDPGRGYLWVVTAEGQMAGYALVPIYFSLEFNGRVAFLDELFVTAAARGHGVGRRLLEELSAWLTRDGVQALRLEVDRRHPEAAALYARHGFTSDQRETWTRRLMPAEPPVSGPLA